MANVKVDLKHLKKGAKVELPYLGVFENGSTTEVSNTKWKRWKSLSASGRSHKGDTLEVTTDAAKAVTDAHRALNEARAAEVGVPSGDPANDAPTAAPLSERSLDDLKELADKASVQVDGNKKSDYVKALSGNAQEG